MKLTQEEWRTIHNALSLYKYHFFQAQGYFMDERRVKEIQQLMDKIRDNFIAVNQQQETKTNGSTKTHSGS